MQVPTRLFGITLLILHVSSVFGLPAAIRLYASDAKVTEVPESEEHVVRLKVEVFHARSGNFVYDLRDKGSTEEEVLLYDGYVPPARIIIAAAQAMEDMWDDQHDDPEVAISEGLSSLNDQFQIVEGTLFMDMDGDIVRRDVLIKSSNFERTNSVLTMRVEFKGDRRVLELEGIAETASNMMWNSSLLECNAGQDDDLENYNCGRLARALDEYAAMLEIRPSYVRARPKSGGEKLEECSHRLVELSCTGTACIRVLPTIGINSGWKMEQKTYHGIVLGKQCCDLYNICKKYTIGNAGSCSLKDDGMGGREMWGMTVGDPRRTPKADHFQAQCQPDCAQGKWGDCRWSRQRCKYNCRCSWWC